MLKVINISIRLMELEDDYVEFFREKSLESIFEEEIQDLIAIASNSSLQLEDFKSNNFSNFESIFSVIPRHKHLYFAIHCNKYFLMKRSACHGKEFCTKFFEFDLSLAEERKDYDNIINSKEAISSLVSILYKYHKCVTEQEIVLYYIHFLAISVSNNLLVFEDVVRILNSVLNPLFLTLRLFDSFDNLVLANFVLKYKKLSELFSDFSTTNNKEVKYLFSVLKIFFTGHEIIIDSTFVPYLRLILKNRISLSALYNYSLKGCLTNLLFVKAFNLELKDKCILFKNPNSFKLDLLNQREKNPKKFEAALSIILYFESKDECLFDRDFELIPILTDYFYLEENFILSDLDNMTYDEIKNKIFSEKEFMLVPDDPNDDRENQLGKYLEDLENLTKMKSSNPIEAHSNIKNIQEMLDTKLINCHKDNVYSNIHRLEEILVDSIEFDDFEFLKCIQLDPKSEILLEKLNLFLRENKEGSSHYHKFCEIFVEDFIQIVAIVKSSAPKLYKNYFERHIDLIFKYERFSNEIYELFRIFGFTLKGFKAIKKLNSKVVEFNNQLKVVNSQNSRIVDELFELLEINNEALIHKPHPIVNTHHIFCIDTSSKLIRYMVF